jgi:Uma2 family endonuclease
MPAAHSDPHEGPYTWEDFIALDEDDLRELIDGELIEVEVPKRRHERLVARIIGALVRWSDERRAGTVLGSGYKVRITNKRGVMPDVQFFRRENEPGPQHEDGLAEGHPDLVVEVVSPSSRKYDRVVKARWYASIGVPEYWIVDPEERTIEQLVLEHGRWVIASGTTGGEAFTPSTFEGLRIEAREPWSDSPDA